MAKGPTTGAFFLAFQSDGSHSAICGKATKSTTKTSEHPMNGKAEV
jgi:hypothetical protein